MKQLVLSVASGSPRFGTAHFVLRETLHDVQTFFMSADTLGQQKLDITPRGVFPLFPLFLGRGLDAWLSVITGIRYKQGRVVEKWSSHADC